MTLYLLSLDQNSFIFVFLFSCTLLLIFCWSKVTLMILNNNHVYTHVYTLIYNHVNTLINNQYLKTYCTFLYSFVFTYFHIYAISMFTLNKLALLFSPMFILLLTFNLHIRVLKFWGWLLPSILIWIWSKRWSIPVNMFSGKISLQNMWCKVQSCNLISVN